MNEYKQFRDIPTSTSQSGLFSIIMLKMVGFSTKVVFSSFSIELGPGQVLYFVIVQNDYNYAIYETIYLVEDLALY